VLVLEALHTVAVQRAFAWVEVATYLLPTWKGAPPERRRTELPPPEMREPQAQAHAAPKRGTVALQRAMVMEPGLQRLQRLHRRAGGQKPVQRVPAWRMSPPRAQPVSRVHPTTSPQAPNAERAPGAGAGDQVPCLAAKVQAQLLAGGPRHQKPTGTARSAPTRRRCATGRPPP
jgi:hypothetical protein